jgi:cardiolipin synthase
MGALLRELLRARRRGVRVRVIVPGQSDVKVVQWATRHVYEFLLKRGVRIYERKDRMLHSKVMVMDGKWSVLGSCNFDARSLHLNHEFFAVVRSQQMAQALESICREEIRASVRVTAAFCRRRSYWQRFLDRAAWTARRWL